MISYFTIGISAVFVSGLTMFSGFGLGTLLMPVFAIFFPVETAVAATALVHGANSFFKIAAVGKHADRSLVISFGLPAILSAFAGAIVLSYLSGFPELLSYEVGPIMAEITPIKLVMGLLMILFALFELWPPLKAISFNKKYLFVGGLLSGFFGGLSGHQGALRSAFLSKVGISPQAFIGTNAMIGFMVDMTRITTYGLIFWGVNQSQTFGSDDIWPLIATGIAAAFIGVRIGKRFLDKITMKTIQNLTGILLLGIAILLASGMI
ncbi:MAG: TSUP family transporter [Desulfobacteraceae bacterium]|nr:TSUP family transporter [Desulfobacteraceae bacterium]